MTRSLVCDLVRAAGSAAPLPSGAQATTTALAVRMKP